jgi:peptide/nickel transport system permease protein
MTTDQPRRVRRRRLRVGWRLGAVYLIAASGLAALAPALPLSDPDVQDSLARLQPPSWNHWLGTDDLGRDVLSRLIHGGRYSLSVGFVAVGLAFAVGVPLGVAGGYWGGWIDRAVAAVVEVLMAFPGVLLALVMIAVLGPGLGNVMIAVGIAQIPHYARQARASTLSVREQEFILAALASGASTPTILTRHVLPNIFAPVVVVATMGLGGAILEAAGLSYLGLSGDPSRPEWGQMLNLSRERFTAQPWLVVAPGLAITLSVLSFNLVGDALRDWLDPRLGDRR